VFLQGWRATLIPLLAVPVSLIGTLAFFPMFGFSINTLSLFGLVLAIALILAAVFVPTVFIPGITGRLYQQFALTIAISMLISAFNALTLSPALSALLLRP